MRTYDREALALAYVDSFNERVMGMHSDRDGYPEKVGPAVVVWCNRGGAGLYFDREDATTRSTVGTLYALLQHSWQAAREVSHARECCKAGLLIEPPLPG